jgi:hypothetical protein
VLLEMGFVSTHDEARLATPPAHPLMGAVAHAIDATSGDR